MSLLRVGGTPNAGTLQLATSVVPRAVDAEAAFLALFAESASCFWLDSSRVESGLSRFSFLGDGTGPLSERLTYRVADGLVHITAIDRETSEPGSIFDVLDDRLTSREIDGPGLPFDFIGGYVGYFGYELKADCDGDAAHQSRTPDAAWLFADRVVVIDHQQARTYLLALHDGGPANRAGADEWLADTSARLADLAPATLPDPPMDLMTPDPERFLARGRRRYLDDIAACQQRLIDGDSYEICLTDTVTIPFDGKDELFYRYLRHLNPAPYAAFLRIDGVTVLSSSPECFLRITPDRRVQSKPIKGTAPRSSDPDHDRALATALATSAKTQAENLMIVDLLRNDLGHVCETGTVTVDRFMAVESYPTVHQLVSTISGVLRADVSSVQCTRHCFPGGSMTGAPKRRTMQIIDRLESQARGVYSGALGYFSLNGAADLSIVIRAAIRQDDELTIGAGGAIVLDSDPQDEYDEMVLKTLALMRAWACATDSVGS
jgi:para-aminobenzoate synthetase